MGFGILLFGYFVMFAFSLSQVYFFADIIGAVVVLLAFSRLSEYNRYFVGAMVGNLAFLVLCTLNAASLMFGLYDPDGSIALAVNLAKAAAACAMHLPMFLGIRGISRGAASEKLVRTSERNLVLTMLYYVLYFLVVVLSPLLAESTPYVSTVVYLYDLVCIFLNLVLFYKCFAILCPADEDENAKKRSRFAIINKINDKMDSIDDERARYREESVKLAMEEADRRAAEKAHKKKHSHPKKKK
ncbi:MAG: hypothetical protein ACI4V1_01305 [Eubacteriales bacterium]